MTSMKEVVKKARTCKLCEHIYLKPCNGKDKTCMNGIWVRSGRDLKTYNEMCAKAGLATTAPAKKSKRVRLVSDEPAKQRKKKRRVKL